MKRELYIVSESVGDAEMTAQPETMMSGDDLLDDANDEPAADSDFRYDLSPSVTVELVRRGPDLSVVMTSDPKSHDQLRDAVEGLDGSLLCIQAQTASDLRSDNVTGFFDALVDGTLLDEFERVLFLAGPEDADAALGFSLCAPMCQVLIFGTPAAISANGRYPVTPETLSTAETVSVIETAPAEGPVAATLRDAGCTLLPFGFGDRVVPVLSRLGVLDDVLSDAIYGDLDEVGFFRALRARRTDRGYLRQLDSRVIKRPVLRLYMLRYMAQGLGVERYAKSYEDLRAKLIAEGVKLPASHAD